MSRLIGFFRQKENLAILVVPLLLLVWARYGAPALGLKSFDSATLYAGPYRGSLPPGEQGDEIVERVILIVVDGLRHDTSTRMSALNRLRSQGADRVMEVGLPSLSLPGWTVMGTGAWQEQSGFASNFVERSVELDSIFRGAGRAGLSTMIVGTGGWEQLFGEHVDSVVAIKGPEDPYADLEGVIRQDEDILQSALEVLQAPPDLLLVYFPGVDNAGHGWGGASLEYERVAQAVDEHIDQLVATIDLERTAVFITADHGHINSGGHSGSETVVLEVPFVALGMGIRPGLYGAAPQSSLAPTLAVMLGTSFPSHNQGRVLSDEIDASEALEAGRTVDNAEQLGLRVASMLSVIGAASDLDQSSLEVAKRALDGGDYPKAVEAAGTFMDGADRQWQDARETRLNRERLLRLPVALALLVPAGLYVGWWRRAGGNWRIPLMAAVLYTVLWNVNYHLIQRLTYSTSWFNTDETILPFLTARVIEALIAIVIVTLLVGIVRRNAPPGEVVRDAVHAMLAIALLLMVQILVFYVLWNVVFEWYLPDFTLGFKYYLDVFQTTVFWPLTPLPLAAVLPLLALGVARIARLVRRGPSTAR